MSGTSPEVIVVGLGAVGSATLYQLAKRGIPALGIDRFEPPHDRGSSHGETRITRLAAGEGDAYVPLVTRAHAIWRELEEETGEDLYRATGGLIFASDAGITGIHHGHPGFASRSIDIARRHGIAHEVLDAGDIARRFPQFILHGEAEGYYEPSAGYVRPERCIAAQLATARRHGAQIRTGETVLSVEADGAGVRIVTDKGVHRAARAVLSAGAWLPGLVGGRMAQRMTVRRQVLYWFEAADPALWAPGRAPIYIWVQGARAEDCVYGFPEIAPGSGVKIGTEQYHESTDPDRVERIVSEAETATMQRHYIDGRFAGLSGACARAMTCFYTVTPDSNFLIDGFPGIENALVVSACSGHGFKHSAGLGDAIAGEIAGEADRIDLSSFSAARLAAAAE